MKDIIMDPKEYIDVRLEDAYKVLTGKMDAVKTSLEGQMQGLRDSIQGLRDQYAALHAISMQNFNTLQKIYTEQREQINKLQEDITLLLKKTSDKQIGFNPEKEEKKE